MKINRPNIKGVAGTYGPGAVRPAEQTQPPASAAPAQTDKVDVSSKARQAASLKAKLKAAPEVRMDLVERIKKQVEDGTYKVDARKVADKLLKSRVLDE